MTYVCCLQDVTQKRWYAHDKKHSYSLHTAIIFIASPACQNYHEDFGLDIREQLYFGIPLTENLTTNIRLVDGYSSALS